MLYMICYQMDMSYKPLEYKSIIPCPASWLRGGYRSASNLMKKSPYFPFGAPARYSYLGATRVILARNKGHFQREASCRKRNMNEGFGHGTSSWPTGLIVHHVKVSPGNLDEMLAMWNLVPLPPALRWMPRLSPDDPVRQVR